MPHGGTIQFTEGGRAWNTGSHAVSAWMVLLATALCSCTMPLVQGVPMHPSQVPVLQTIQDAWRRTFDGWSSMSDCSKAYGLTCNEKGEIVSMNLGFERLEGMIPSTLGFLTSLTQLHLYGNQLTGSIPGYLSTLTNLWSLYLDSNQLDGSIPNVLSTLTNLRGLWLNNNQFTGSLSPSFGTLKNLRCLWLHETGISGELPVSLATMPALANVTVPSSVKCPPSDAQCPGMPRPEGRNVFCNLTCPGFCNNCSAGLSFGVSSELPNQAKFLNKNVFRHASTSYNYADSGWDLRSSALWTTKENRLRPTGSLVPLAKDQVQCGACWAYASVAAVGAAAAIALNFSSNKVPDLSVQHVIRCGSDQGCDGGLPSAAFDYMVNWSRSGLQDTGNYTSLLTEADYNVTANKCTVATDKPTQIAVVTYEQADFYGWFGLLLTLREQPAVVTLYANCQKFMNAKKFGVLKDEENECDGVPNHAVLAVGYVLSSNNPYWVLQNSWGTRWGDNGTIRVAITGGFGVCNMHLAPALYPVIATPNPCRSLINVCGSGTCVPNGPGRSRCECRSPFINKINNDGLTESCVPEDVCGFFLFNPCSVGTCVNDHRGNYLCICPPGFVDGQRSTDGASTCVPGSLLGQLFYTVAVPGLTCGVLAGSFGLTEKQLREQNSNLDCSQDGIPAPTRLNVTSPTVLARCSLVYAWNQEDSCRKVAPLFDLSVEDFAAMNPWLNCSRSLPQPGMQVCVQRSGAATTLSLPECTMYYPAQSGDTCETIWAEKELTAADFYRLNPGINCDKLQRSTWDTVGQQVCISANMVAEGPCPTGGVPWEVPNGTTCLNLYARHGRRRLRALNRGAECTAQWLTVGKIICIPGENRRPPPVSKR